MGDGNKEKRKLTMEFRFFTDAAGKKVLVVVDHSHRAVSDKVNSLFKKFVDVEEDFNSPCG